MDEVSFLEVIDPEVVMVFTDGSCWPNPNGKGGWGFVAMYREFVCEKSGHLPSTTNNIAEITAIQMALQTVNDGALPIHLITDSQYALKAMTQWPRIWEKQGWLNSVGEPVANADLIRATLALIEDREGEVKFHWVKGHKKADTPYKQFNARAHFLAGEARKND